MKKLLSAILTFALTAALLICPALALLDQSDSFYVNDDADVLTDSTEKEMISQNGELEYSCSGAQIVVVTIEYLPSGYDSEQYANLLFNNWGVGSASENNGMLLLLVTEEGRGWLVTGAGIAPYLSDDEIDSMLSSYLWPKFDAGDYNGAVNSLFPQLTNWFEDYYGVTLGSDESAPLVGNGNGNGNGSGGSYQDYGYNYQYGGYNLFGTLIRTVVVLFIIGAIVGAIGGNSVGRQRYYGRTGVWPWLFLFGLTSNRNRRPPNSARSFWDDDRNGRGGGFGGFGGGGFGGGGHSGGGFGGGGFGGGGHSGMGHGGGGFSGGGGGGRR